VVAKVVTSVPYKVPSVQKELVVRASPAQTVLLHRQDPVVLGEQVNLAAALPTGPFRAAAVAAVASSAEAVAVAVLLEPQVAPVTTKALAAAAVAEATTRAVY